ncbi:MAG: sodium:solute symporter, partial [Brevinematales bacterium]
MWIVQGVFLLYWVAFLWLAWTKRKTLHSYDDYVVAGRRQSANMVWFSLLATSIGASVVIGMINMAGKIGWPIFWWLGVGAIGLGLQAWLLTLRVREMEVNTLPQLVERLLGKSASRFVALVIAISWIGIVAAQFKAMGTVMAVFWPDVDGRIFVALSAVVMIVYTILGGQMSVMATDRWQFLLIVLAIVFPLALGLGDQRSYKVPFVFLNEAFGWKDLLVYLVLTGGAYFVGPDMFSRAFCARDGKTARLAVAGAAVGLVPLALAITWVGIMASQLGPADGVAILKLVGEKAGLFGKVIVAFGILSALISSADTTLLSSAIIWNQDVFGKKSVQGIRIAIGGIGLVAIVLALLNTSLLSM